MSSLVSIWRRQWTKLGLTRDVAVAVLKNTLPATAALWLIQSRAVGQGFDTVGFLPIIVTILMTPSLPRIPYLRLLVFTLFLNAFILCITLLAGYCSTQARLHTTPRGGRLDAYNSSAAAVSAIWLIFVVWSLQTYRTYNPSRAKSVVLVSIFAEVSIITSTTLTTTQTVISFNLQLFEMFLFGYALSAFTCLFIFPKTSRDVTNADISKMFDMSQKALASDIPFGDPSIFESPKTPAHSAASCVKSVLETFAKFQIDIADAKRDVGWSIFSPSDFRQIVVRFRDFLVPLRGLFAVESIRMKIGFALQASDYDRKNTLGDPDNDNTKQHWDAIFEELQEPISQLHTLTADSFDHCRILMHLPHVSPAKKSGTGDSGDAKDSDSEKATQDLPGGRNFVTNFTQRIDQHRNDLNVIIARCKEDCGGVGSVEDLSSKNTFQKQHSPTASMGRLMFILYVEHMYRGILDALLELVKHCDARFAHSKRKLQLPGKKRFIKLIRRLTEHHHVEGDMEDMQSEIPNLTLQRSRMPEREMKMIRGINIQRLNELLDKPFRILGGPQSFFGLRVACAIMSVAIVGYLGQTQQWFFNRRGIWAAIFIPFSMAPSSGEAKSLLLFRVLGTALSIPVSLLNWYIVDGATVGVIIFFFVISAIQQYFIVKFPAWGSFWRPCIITYSVIVGYSLQSRYSKTPQPPATTTDQYPIYLIGPYRGLTTLVGVAVAYVWTVFPQPSTANSIMQRRVGQALFGLAEYHDCMHHAILSWAGHYQGDPNDKTSVAYRLGKVRRKMFVKQTALLAVIRAQHEFANFDITLGGRGTEHRYVTIAEEIDRIMAYVNVVAFVSAHFQYHIHEKPKEKERSGPWESGVSDLVVACNSTSKKLAALIHILASSVTNNQPLPPFLESPESFAVARKLRKKRPDLMNPQHADEEGYKAFAVIEISVANITKSLDRILTLVRDMVGEVGINLEIPKDK